MTTPGAVAAMLLAQGRLIDRLSMPLTLAALVLPFFGAPHLLMAGVVVAGLGQSWFALRVRFDAALFDALAKGGSLEELEASLLGLGLMPAAKAGRPLEDRVAGARRLMARQAMLLLAQVVVMVAAALRL